MTESELSNAVRQQSLTIAQLRSELAGVEKANRLLMAGMESQCELMDGLKQDLRRKEAALKRIVEMVEPMAALSRFETEEVERIAKGALEKSQQ